MVSQNHLQLSAIVKGVHAELRRKYKGSKNNDEKVWKEHCRDTAKLEEYSLAMHQLATQHWPIKTSECRIEWCRNVCLEYFLQDGLHKALEKDLRKELHYHHRYTPETQHSEQSTTNVYSSTKCNSPWKIPERNYETLIQLLDVGSCYNPFGQMPEFFSVAIDLCPAVPNVLQCDFLNLRISRCDNDSTVDLKREYLQNLTSPLETLASKSFDVVVFSLLLEYLPSQKQRWHCCKLAHQLLRSNGLLLIITPDSKHQNYRAKMIKSWKIAIESLGFSRWRYHKMAHVHCMAFRKITFICYHSEVENPIEMIYIPQDFQELVEEEECSARNDQENQDVGSFFEELPEFID